MSENIRFESSWKKNSEREELKRARERVLSHAEKRAKREAERKEQEGSWMLPDLDKALDSGSEKKHKKKKKKEKKSKKSKKSKRSSSSSEDEWVEKKPRDSWMSSVSVKSDKKSEAVDNAWLKRALKRAEEKKSTHVSKVQDLLSVKNVDEESSNKVKRSSGWRVNKSEHVEGDETKHNKHEPREMKHDEDEFKQLFERKKTQGSKSREMPEVTSQLSGDSSHLASFRQTERDDFSKDAKAKSDTQTGSPEPGTSKKEQGQVLLSDKEMNALGAKLVKAEMMGNESKAKQLREKLEAARLARSKQNEAKVDDDEDAAETTVVLTVTDSKGMTRPLNYSEATSKAKVKGSVATHSDGKRVRYFADDDRYDLKQMFEREKMSTAEDQNGMMSRLAGKSLLNLLSSARRCLL